MGQTNKDSARQESNILSQGKKRRFRRTKLIGDGRKDERGHNGPEVVTGPAKTNDDEKLPLIPTHANILNL